MKKKLYLVLIIIVAIGIGSFVSTKMKASDNTTASNDTKRVACILGGPISDMSWNYTAYQGLLKIEAMGAEITYQENVDNSSLADSINTYANDGYDMIILSTNTYEETALPIIEDYPDTQFIIINGETTKDNVTSYQVSDEDQGFMQGVICATISTSKKVGFVGAMEITPILNGRSGFEQGVKYIDQDIEISSVMTGSFTDVAAAKETAKALIQKGVDAIAPMCDNAALGVDEAAEEGGIFAAASGEDQDSVAPNAVVCAVVKDTSIIYEKAYQDYLDDKLDGTSGIVKLGAKDGVVYLSDWYQAADNLSEEQKTKISQAYEDLASGKISVTIQ